MSHLLVWAASVGKKWVESLAHPDGRAGLTVQPPLLARADEVIE